MGKEFLDLIQGNNSVAVYEDTFNALSRFSSTLVDTEEKRYRHFLDRLNMSTRDPLEPLRITNFADLVDMALFREIRVYES